jgi:hypothetical protein
MIGTGRVTTATIWGSDMETFQAQLTEAVIDDDVLTLTRKKIGKDHVRRIPLAAITEVRFKSGRFGPAMLQLVLNDEPPADISPADPNTLVFSKTPKHNDSMARLQARLEAAAEHNRAAGTGPVAYDAPRRNVFERLVENIDEQLERTAQKQAEQAAHRAEVARLEAEAAELRRVDEVRQELAAEGIARDDVLAAALATTFLGTIATEIPVLARTLLPDEPLLHATTANFDGHVGMIAVTPARFISLSKAAWSDQTAEFPLTAIVSVGSERELLSNELTVRLHSGQTSTYTNVDDLPAFTNTLRTAVRNATPPTPTPTATPAPAPAPQQSPPAPQQDVLAQIAKLADLHAAGILTADEFQSKKTELLNRL